MSPELHHRLDEWSKSTEYMRNTTRPMDVGEQMAQRDAYSLLTDLAAQLVAAEARVTALAQREAEARRAIQRVLDEIANWHGYSAVWRRAAKSIEAALSGVKE